MQATRKINKSKIRLFNKGSFRTKRTSVYFLVITNYINSQSTIDIQQNLSVNLTFSSRRHLPHLIPTKLLRQPQFASQRAKKITSITNYSDKAHLIISTLQRQDPIFIKSRLVSTSRRVPIHPIHTRAHTHTHTRHYTATLHYAQSGGAGTVPEPLTKGASHHYRRYCAPPNPRRIIAIIQTPTLPPLSLSLLSLVSLALSVEKKCRSYTVTSSLSGIGLAL